MSGRKRRTDVEDTEMQDLHFMEELLGLGVFIALVAVIYYADIALATYRNSRQYDDRLVSERGLRLPVASDHEAAIPQSVRDNPVWGSE